MTDHYWSFSEIVRLNMSNKMNLTYKILVVLLFTNVVGCTTAYKIDDNSPKATLKIDLTHLGKKTGFSSIFSGTGYRMEFYQYNVETCEAGNDKVAFANSVSPEEIIDIPAGNSLYMEYFYYSHDAAYTEKGLGVFGFSPQPNHNYEFIFKLGEYDFLHKKIATSIKVVDITNPNKPLKRRIYIRPKKCRK